MTTTGDQNLLQPLYLMGGKSLWTKELEVALLNGNVDLIVHSLKDMPTCLPSGCQIGAIIEREDPRDALVIRNDLPFRTLKDLPPGSVIGTSSVRRVAQLRRRYPHLAFQDIRGNLNTRFKKLDAADSPYTAIILAVAGLVRLGCADRISSYLEPPELFHAVGQGAIGIEIRSPLEFKPDETEPETLLRERSLMVQELVKSLEDWRTALRCEAERALLNRLEGGCSVPVGVNTILVDLPMPCPWAPKARLTLTGVVTSVDGKEEVQRESSFDICGPQDARRLGVQLADQLFKHGAWKILQELDEVKKSDPDESRIAAATIDCPTTLQVAAPANSARTIVGSNEDYSLVTVPS
ncbi:hypothetical protein O181_110864 [Austropuccinia psidii MF-1]|uniref:Porphobilinogen deaminase n=1 Tax=Austropuccinia psidii MF-1 TaxID=1389203 RepID=A0A9Q3K0W8_9BASI|nr:hypothetical protein [Austropuccinia psidii MF-1]